MNIYNKIQINENEIILEKIIIDINIYDIINLDNGNIKLIKKQIIKISSIEDLKNYNFSKSNIIECFINNNKVNKNKYKSILNDIYIIINDGSKIIKNTKLNIKTINKYDEGFYYISELGISIQRVDSNKCINEILSQSILNNIKINIIIKLSNNTIINVIN
jgi:hypothetical protein